MNTATAEVPAPRLRLYDPDNYRDLASSALPEATVNPILARPGAAVQHEESLTIKGRKLTVRVLTEAHGYSGAWKCSCHQGGRSKAMPSIEAAMRKAIEFAGQHVVEKHGK